MPGFDDVAGHVARDWHRGRGDLDRDRWRKPRKRLADGLLGLGTSPFELLRGVLGAGAEDSPPPPARDVSRADHQGDHERGPDPKPCRAQYESGEPRRQAMI